LKNSFNLFKPFFNYYFIHKLILKLSKIIFFKRYDCFKINSFFIEPYYIIHSLDWFLIKLKYFLTKTSSRFTIKLFNTAFLWSTLKVIFFNITKHFVFYSFYFLHKILLANRKLFWYFALINLNLTKIIRIKELVYIFLNFLQWINFYFSIFNLSIKNLNILNPYFHELIVWSNK